MKPFVPKIDCETRWNSTYDMIQHALDRNGPLKAAIFAHMDSKLIASWLSTNDWNMLKKLVEVLKPLKEITLVVSAKGFSIAEVLPVYEYSLFQLNKSKQELIEENAYESLRDGIKDAVDKLEHYFSILSPIAGAALLLHPRIKKSSLKDVSQWKPNWKEDCLYELKKVNYFLIRIWNLLKIITTIRI